MIGQTEGVWALIENRYRQTFLTPPTGTEPHTLQHFISYLTQIILFLAVQDSAIGDIVSESVSQSLSHFWFQWQITAEQSRAEQSTTIALQ